MIKISPFRTTIYLVAFIVLLLSGSCKKDSLLTDGSAKLSPGTDTLTFDTLFVSLGSTTKYFTLRNQNDRPVKVSSITLGGGASSQFRFNVDGDPAPTGVLQDIEIPGKDSIYVFVEITVDPNAEDLPFLLLDSLQFVTNGNLQKVILQAYGQNAHFFNGEEITSNTVWNNDRPYVILNSLVVRPGVTLTINQGCKLYFGNDSGLFVEGNLKVFGQQDSTQKVIFRGVRLDKISSTIYYDDLPGQWLGIFFLRGSTGNMIEHARIRNSLYGVNAGNIRAGETPSVANAPELVMRNTEIYNHTFYGIFGILADIKGENILAHSCGRQVISILLGGKYNFEHCTFFTRGSAFLTHREPLMVVTNYLPISPTEDLAAELESAVFKNCIIYGTEQEELLTDSVQPVSGPPLAFNYTFENCLLKTKRDLSASPFVNCIANQDPRFKDERERDFHLLDDSPARGAGATTSLSPDLNGVPRINPPDIGVFQFQ